ncbi:hypothetical protein AC481_00075 [miscellaneous Crenarchaeota group archaeon SMTZ-80]|nr:MAG: hypothetical protein AC481_00075 [miscellaneous Crenarchaeota group archaeon SMTZ-80]
MITGFAIILEDEILYVSNKNKFPTFEIVLFVEKLINSINPKNLWRLTNIFFEGKKTKERMIIKHITTEQNQNLFYCITGDFISNSHEADKLMDEFYEKVSVNYETIDKIKEFSKRTEFKKVIQLITGYLWDKYHYPLEDEEFDYQCATTENKIIYCGLSSQGLPILSQLYDTSLLHSFHREVNHENIDLFTSNLSARLATIAMNTQIRAKTNIKEIHFEDLQQQGCKKLILYGIIEGYSLDFIASGDFFKIKEIFDQLEQKISKEPILHQEFSGDLKPYRSLKSYLDEILVQFDQ